MRLSCQSVESLARDRLTRPLFEFIAGGADDESTVRANARTWSTFEVLPRVLVDVSSVGTSSAVLGQPVNVPLIISPMGSHRRVHDEGEQATAAVARDLGAVFVLSVAGFCSIEEIGAVGGSLWLQLYWLSDREVLSDLIRRAEQAGFSAICLTVDSPQPGLRLRDKRNAFTDPPFMKYGSLEQYGDALVTKQPGKPFYFPSLVDRSITWADLEWLLGVTRLPIVLKGIVRPDDALQAAKVGAKGVFVSNHGGRQLGRIQPTAVALREIAAICPNDMELYVDGGVRSGLDMFVALALGARAVGIGRPILYALGCLGKEGLAELLSNLQEDLARTMTLCGTASLSDVGPANLTQREYGR